MSGINEMTWLAPSSLAVTRNSKPHLGSSVGRSVSHTLMLMIVIVSDSDSKWRYRV